MKTLKSLIFLILLLVNFANLSFSQKNGGEGLLFDTLICDLGILEKGSPAECNFSFVNNEDTSIIITNVKASCGCTVPQWPHKPLTPGKKETIKVKYNTSKKGVFLKTIMVYTSFDSKAIILTLKGEVVKGKK